MPVGTDEVMLLVDGGVDEDPSAGLRERAAAFVASRQWTTDQIFAADQPENADDLTAGPWSLSVAYGLDHASRKGVDWFADVTAIIEFVHSLCEGADREFGVELRWRSALWYSHHVATIEAKPPNLPAIREMIERGMRHPPSLPRGAASLRTRFTRWFGGGSG